MNGSSRSFSSDYAESLHSTDLPVPVPDTRLMPKLDPLIVPTQTRHLDNGRVQGARQGLCENGFTLSFLLFLTVFCYISLSLSCTFSFSFSLFSLTLSFAFFLPFIFLSLDTIWVLEHRTSTKLLLNQSPVQKLLLLLLNSTTATSTAVSTVLQHCSTVTCLDKSLASSCVQNKDFRLISLQFLSCTDLKKFKKNKGSFIHWDYLKMYF